MVESRNYISLSPTGTTSNVHCIAVNIGGTGTNNTVSIHDNTIENINWSSATTGVFYGIRIYVSAGANPKDMNIYNNIIRNNTINGTGNLNLIHSGASAGTNNISIYSNQIYGNQKSGASGTMNCVLATTATVLFHDNMIYNNTIPTTTGTSAAVLYGYYNYGSPLSENIYNNTIYGLSIGGTTTATASIVRGIYTTTASALKNIYSNQSLIIQHTPLNRRRNCGRYLSNFGSMTSVYKNNIYNLSTTGASGLANGITIAGGATNHIYNNYVSDIKAPAATGANAVIGINISGVQPLMCFTTPFI